MSRSLKFVLALLSTVFVSILAFSALAQTETEPLIREAKAVLGEFDQLNKKLVELEKAAAQASVAQRVALTKSIAEHKKLMGAQIDAMTTGRAIPEELKSERVDDSTRKRPILFRREAGPARVTIFEGGHEGDTKAAVDWLARLR